MKISSNDKCPLLKANQIENEANRRIHSAQKKIKEQQIQSNEALDKIQDSYQKQYTTQQLKQEAILESQKLKGYEQLRNLKNAQENLIKKIQHEGAREVSELKDYYFKKIYDTHQLNEKSLENLKDHYFKKIEHEKNIQHLDLNELKSLHEKKFHDIKELAEQEIKDLKIAKDQELIKIKNQTENETLTATEKLQKKVNDIQQKNQETIERLQTQSSKKLQSITLETAQKLSAYKNRHEDPFYKLIELGAQFYDEGESYVIKIEVPEFEHKHITASIKGNEFLISGYRKNEESVDLGLGRIKNTGSFQSFNETFPLHWPVEDKKLIRYSEGDTLFFKVPKKNQFALKEKSLLKSTDIQSNKPRFPENLPISKEKQLDQQQHLSSHSLKKSTSGTLS